MDLSKLSIAELEALAAGQPLPGGSGGPLTFDVTKMSDAELKKLAGEPLTTTERLGRAGGLAARASMTGILGGLSTPATLTMDAAVNAAYGAKKLAAKTGLVDAPDPTNYYGKEGYLPFTARVGRAAAKPADVIGLPEPETAGERFATAAIEGATGAVGGLGVGAAARLVPLTARFGRFAMANPALQTVAGTAGGVGAQAAVEGGVMPSVTAPAAGVGAAVAAPFLVRGGLRTFGRAADAALGTNLVPRSAKSTTEAGQAAIAGEILRERAENAPQALRNIETHAPEIAGWRHTGVAAARDPGIASLEARMRDWAKNHGGSGPMQMHQQNSTILSNALDRLGAARGGDADRAAATQAAREFERSIPTLPRGRENIDVTDLMGDLNNMTRRQGFKGQQVEAATQIREMLEQSARPRYRMRADGTAELTGYTITPLNLHNLRVDIGSVPGAASLGAARRQGKAKLGKATEGSFREYIDDLLGTHLGPEYQGYLTEQRSLRSAADQKAFIKDLADETQAGVEPFIPGSGVTPARNIDMTKFSRRVSEKNIDKPIPGGDSRFMSIERLEDLGRADPMSGAALRADLLRRAKADIDTGAYGTGPGTGSRGSNTVANAEINDMIQNRVQQTRGFMSRATDVGLGAAEQGIYGLSRFGGLVGGQAGAGLANFMGRVTTGGTRSILNERTGRAVEGVQRQLARGYENPAFMAELMRQAPLRTPLGPGAWAADAAMRYGRYGYQGALAGDRRGRYR